MYERPPSVKPTPSGAMRYLAGLPLVVATASGCVLIQVLLVELMQVDEGKGWFQLSQFLVVMGLIACIGLLVSLGVMRSLKRQWNPRLLAGFSIVSLIGLLALLYGLSRL